MATRDKAVDTSQVPTPDFLLPGIRCALEMALVGVLVLFLGFPTSSALYAGLVVVLAVVAMVVVLFWSLNRQMEVWIARARRTPHPSETE